MKMKALIFAIAMATTADLVRGCVVDVMEDPDVKFVQKTHQTVTNLTFVNPPYNFIFAYDIYNVTTGDTYSEYETCYKDFAVGTYNRISLGGNRTTIEFTITDADGYRPSVRKDFHTQEARHGYGRIAGSKAYVSVPVDTPMALLGDAEAIEAASPEGIAAYKTHHIVMKYYQLRAPYDIVWGYEYKVPEKGRIVSQYEEYKGLEGHGKLVFMEKDGTQTAVTTKVNTTGFYVTAPITYKRSKSPGPFA